ncbi:hypothetical protein P9761_04355 [Brevibacillus centrosporus]|uniref:hypothetical protein n=1 Tax=Brevibacillus centrosporus TaxID=54910 RepID=UPI002E23943E|nr:hypothetical protein [Brevibacillus centrosporus]
MIVLDCETVGTMYESVESITGINRSDLEAFFSDFDMDKFYEENPDFYESGDGLLLLKIREMEKCNIQQIDAVNWFHLTRTYKGNSFNQGILSLGEGINHIWDILYELQKGHVSKEEWDDFRHNKFVESKSHSAWLYHLKLGDKFHWGPYAMLVREIAFVSEEVGNHDYLDAPEIVEDICHVFDGMYHCNLLERFRMETYPCIVKFQSNQSKDYYLGIVLNFLYYQYHGMEMSLHCNTCFDGKGESVTFEQILKVEFI